MGQTDTRLKLTRFVSVTLVFLVVLCCLATVPWLLGQRGQRGRRLWKEAAIPLIAKWADDQNGRAQEIGALTNRISDTRVLEEGWLTDKMILMGSGEWLVYKSHCSKEAPHLVND